MKLTAPQRGVLASFAFLLISMLSAQALAFDVGGFSYSITSGTTVDVTGRASGNTDTDIVIPATVADGSTTYSVTSIGRDAFQYNALTSVIIPDSVTTIGGQAFLSNALTSVTIPDSVTTIESSAFAVNDLTSVTIGNSVTTIVGAAFQYNVLTSVIIPDSVTTIGEQAFLSNALTSVIIPDSLSAIGSLAFDGNALTNVAFEGNFRMFASNTFESNPNLATITSCEDARNWPQTFSGIRTTPVDCSPAPALAFDVGGFSYSITSGTTVDVTGRASGNTDTDIVIPATVADGSTTYSVTSIGRDAFQYNALTSVIIPDSVTTIGGQAFLSNALTSVTIPDSVTTIESSAFAVNDLTSVTIGNSVTTIVGAAFQYNVLTSVIIPDSVTTIGEQAFLSNALTSVIIPDSLSAIGSLAFDGNALTNVAFEGNFRMFASNTFESNPNLATITSCEDARNWPQTFSGIRTTPVDCSPAPALAFDVGGFSYSITSGTTVDVTGRASGNTDTDMVIPATVADGSTTYSVTSIGRDAFQYNALTSVIIPDSVTTIGGQAFLSNALTSVTIPSSVTTIEVAAFSDNALTSAHFGGNFGDFQLNTTGSGSTEREAMFDVNPNLTTITYCEGTTGWPQDFSNGSTTITATSIVCSPPDAPTIDSITPGAGQLTVAFTPGIDNGSPASSYTASCLRVVGSGRVRVNVVGPTSPITVTSLYNDDTYECFVTATNIIGTSPASATSEPFVVGGPDTVAPPPSGTPPSSATPVPTSPLWLLGIMAGLLSLVGIRKLRKV
ncbi:fibronectin type III domain-containing protein [Halioglobus sp. Uisw_031]|uniref:fibronectin type III domain-containing protein n=1 Tax=Halioglobus sp. Uisw_031 TaxID=3230977 RepID=UPI0039EC873B